MTDDELKPHLNPHSLLTDPVDVFDAVEVQVPPGTKAPPRPPGRERSQASTSPQVNSTNGVNRTLIVSKRISRFADSYQEAAEVVWTKGLEQGNPSLPSLVLAAFAIELYLKAYLATEEKIPVGNGVDIVKQDSNVYGHIFTKLFDKIPDDVRQRLTAQYASQHLGSSPLRDVLATYENVFVGVRYIHESGNEQHLPDRPDVLFKLAKFFRSVNQALPEYGCAVPQA